MNRRFKHPIAVLTGALAVGSLTAGATRFNVLAQSSTHPAVASMVYGQRGITSPQPSVTSTVYDPNNTTTPIKHVVVIFDENQSFDRYFATYPNATNPAGEPPFYAAPNTPSVNGLTGALLTNNPNLTNPQRLDRSQAVTPDFNHGYTAEQKAYDGGLLDKFVQSTGNNNPIVMDYYDGNSVTGLWNYAQHYSLSDNNFGTTFGPSVPGHQNLISGQTHGAIVYSSNSTTGTAVQLKPGDPGFPASNVTANGTLIANLSPYFDKYSTGKTVEMTGKNIGDLLNTKGITWGYFQGGFDDPSATHTNITGVAEADFANDPFQYYKSTSNPNRLTPTSVDMIGHTDQANHQYDLPDFTNAAEAGNLPAVSILVPYTYQNGHPGNSDPLDEQTWIANTINQLESSPSWSSTAVFVTWDDSDGWYDHVMPPIVNQSNDPNADALDGPGNAGNPPAGTYLDRLGYGPRIPLLVISPYAKHNYVSNSLTDQSSIIRFVEDNWNLGRIGDQSFDAKAGSLNDMFDFSKGYYNPPVFLDPNTGEPVTSLTPFEQHGQLYMAVNDLAQSLNVQPHQNGDEVWFMYGGHLVEIPSHGDTVTVDMNPVHLGSPIVNQGGHVCLPIANLSNALGVKPVQYQSKEILFESAH